MNFLGLNIHIKNLPILDVGFIPMAKFCLSYLEGANKPLKIAVERNDGYVSIFDTHIHGTGQMEAADKFYVERTVKFLLWARGGYRITVCGDRKIWDYIRRIYSKTGRRAFDNDFMARIYEKDFVVEYAEYEDAPVEKLELRTIGNNTAGCKIGFDAGGSDRKVSAVIDGKTVYSEEILWFPKLNEDPDYHYREIVSAFKTAASKMPKVDGIGVSSAGIHIDNRTMASSLFIKVPENLMEKVKSIYINTAREIGNIPLTVANDGDVTALAGMMATGKTGILGIAMGTSEAAGYVNGKGKITGWLNELAFAPVDANPDGTIDEWSGDIGCGVKYFSQDSVIKLAPKAGIDLSKGKTPAECLKIVQSAMLQTTKRAGKIYKTIGCYLGHTLAYYSMFYDINHVMLLGRVMSESGGEIILKTAKEVLLDEYPDISSMFTMDLPDENSRRIGQSVAAASL